MADDDIEQFLKFLEAEDKAQTPTSSSSKPAPWAALEKGGKVSSSSAKKCLTANAVSQYHVEYKASSLSRPELKATYSGIQPKTKSKTYQAVDTRSNVALMGPQSNKALAKAAKKAIEASEAAKQKHFDLKRQMEKEMIKDALDNPLSLAARNLALATGSDIPMSSSKLKIVDKRVDLSKFANAKDVLKEAKPRLGRGLTPGQIVFGPDPALLRNKKNIRKELAELKKAVEAARLTIEPEKIELVAVKEMKPLIGLPMKRPIEALKESPEDKKIELKKQKTLIEPTKQSPFEKKSDLKKQKLLDIQARLKLKISSLSQSDNFTFDLN